MLGALLLAPEAMASVSEQGLKSEDFYRPAHQHIYDAIRALFSAGNPADTVTVADELRRHGLLDEIGGIEGLVDLQNTTPAISSVGHYARIVQDTAMLRRLIHVAGDIAEIAYSEPDDVTKALDEAETRVFRVAEDRVTTPLARSRISSMRSWSTSRTPTSEATPSPVCPPGSPISTTSSPGCSRAPSTSLAPDPPWAKQRSGSTSPTHVAQSSDKPVMVFSLEMGHQELAQRVLSSEARVDSSKLRTGKLLEAEWTRIGKAIGRLEVPLYLDDNPRVTVMEIRAKARRLKAKAGGLSLIVIDYLQLMTSGGYVENRQLEVSEISRNLKILARELEVPIVALSQLSRRLEERSDNGRCSLISASRARSSRTPTW